jgi:transposase-like protein
MEVNPNVLQRWRRELRQALAKRFPVTGSGAGLKAG